MYRYMQVSSSHISFGGGGVAFSTVIPYCTGFRGIPNTSGLGIYGNDVSGHLETLAGALNSTETRSTSSKAAAVATRMINLQKLSVSTICYGVSLIGFSQYDQWCP
jgi:hypothetical protein